MEVVSLEPPKEDTTKANALEVQSDLHQTLQAEEENPQEIVPEELREPIAEAYEQSTFLAELRQRAQARIERARQRTGA